MGTHAGASQSLSPGHPADSPEKWRFSSAPIRARAGLEFGCPLLKEHWQS